MRGISPIVSTILMVAIAIAAAVVVYYITMDVVTQQGAQLQTTEREGTLVLTGIKPLDSITTPLLTAYLQNVGDSNTVVSAVLVEHNGDIVCKWSQAVEPVPSSAVTVEPGKTLELQVTLTCEYAIPEGEEVDVIIVTEGGQRIVGSTKVVVSVATV